LVSTEVTGSLPATGGIVFLLPGAIFSMLKTAGNGCIITGGTMETQGKIKGGRKHYCLK
jgi:hypothetical protein